MRSIAAVLSIVFLFPGRAGAQAGPDFARYFHDATMRIDYFHTGDAEREFISIDQVYVEGAWAGSLNNLVTPFDNGRYFVKIRDPESGELIFSKGFDCYYGEYRTTDPAAEGILRTYHESALIPWPRGKFIFAIEKRARDNSLTPLFSQEIDPGAESVIHEPPEPGTRVIEALINGDPHRKVDLAFIAEGYSVEDREKVEADLQRLMDIFFSQEPYRSHRDDFNIYGVFRPSSESGIDEPTRDVYRNTAINSTFNSLGLPRYALTEDNRSLRDIAAHVPYDAIVIMVNSERYGGGGIYNWYALSTVDNDLSGHVFLHEFGHSFGGLADEYYSSAVAYNDFYPRGVEPTEPNITALLEPGKVKWGHLVEPGTPIPTPWEKEEYDSIPSKMRDLQRETRARIEDMKESGAPEAMIGKAEEDLRKALDQLELRMLEILYDSPVTDKVGAFEGAGYASTGLYRPMLSCLMFRNTPGDRSYCRVCEDAIMKVIDYHCGRH